MHTAEAKARISMARDLDCDDVLKLSEPNVNRIG
jgi:hypothetical protein